MKHLILRSELSVILLSLCLVVSGCGYSFQGSGSVLPQDVTKVSVPLVENNSTEPGLAPIVTEALRERFERFGVLTVVDDRKDADAVLIAKVVSVRRETSAVTSNDETALRYDTVMTLAAELRRVSGPLLWQNNRMVVSKSFGTESSAVVTSSADFAGGGLAGSDLAALDVREISRGQEQEALGQLAEEVAKQVYNQAVAPDF